MFYNIGALLILHQELMELRTTHLASQDLSTGLKPFSFCSWIIRRNFFGGRFGCAHNRQ